MCSYTAWSLDQSILRHSDDGSVYTQMVGVADSSTYGVWSPPSWRTPAWYQEMCYLGDTEVCSLFFLRSRRKSP
jgi:hypothetical protein